MDVRFPWWLALAMSLSLLAVGCPGDDDDSAADDDAADDDDTDGGPEVICNEPPALGDGPWFTDVTDELGLGADGLDIQGSLVASADVNDDRWPDLYLSKASQSRDDPAEPAHNVRLLLNVGGAAFEDVTFDSGFTDTRDGAQGRTSQFAIFGDLDNDGDTDAYTATFFGVGTEENNDRSEILLNNGDGTFTLGPENVFTDDPDYDAVVAAAMLDHEHDGFLDIYVGHHYAQYGYVDSSGQDSLFVGDGLGSFTDVTIDAGMETIASAYVTHLSAGTNHRPTWGVTACDVDGDGFTDLMSTAYGRQFNMLWHANGDGTYDDIGRDVGYASDDNEDYTDNYYYDSENWNHGWDDQPFRNGGNSAASICGDLDNDGDMDLLQVELRHGWAGQSSDMTELLINDGVGTGGEFDRPGNPSTGLEREYAGGSGWNLYANEGDLGGALFDFDHDGQLDVLVASSDYPDTWSCFWRQKDDGTFVEETSNSGLKIHRGHGVSLTDFDRDGDYDVVMGTSLMRWESGDDPPNPGAAYVYVLRNDYGQDANRLMIELEGTGTSNHDAIGARIVATAGDDVFTREITGGHGIDGQQNDFLQLIGTGEHCTVDTLEIHWPDAEHSVTSFDNVRANYVIRAVQGQELEYMSMDEYVGG
jgi:enediyne biosynthesis protein E4